MTSNTQYRTLPAMSPGALNSKPVGVFPFQQQHNVPRSHANATTSTPLLPPLHTLCNSATEQAKTMMSSPAKLCSSLLLNQKTQNVASSDIQRWFDKVSRTSDNWGGVSNEPEACRLSSLSPTCLNSFPQQNRHSLCPHTPSPVANTPVTTPSTPHTTNVHTAASTAATTAPTTDNEKKHNIYTGVSRSGLAGWRSQLSRKGKTIHLGTFPTAEDAARAWDRAAVAERGRDSITNFPVHDYLDEEGKVKPETEEEAARRCKAKVHKEFRGVYSSGTYGRWKARIVVNGKKIHLGTFGSATEAARAWDRSAIFYRGADTQTNFDLSEYTEEVLRARREEALQGETTTVQTPTVTSGKRQRGEDESDDDRAANSMVLRPDSNCNESKCPTRTSSWSTVTLSSSQPSLPVLPPLKNMISLLSLCNAAERQ